MRIYTKIASLKSLTPLEVNEATTIQDLKTQIQEKTNISTENIKTISFAGNDLNSSYTLSYYKIKRDSLLYVAISETEFPTEAKKPRAESPNNRIFVNQPSGKSLAIELKKTDSLTTLKNRVATMSKINEESFDLCKNRLDESKTLSDYNLGNCILRMMLKLRDDDLIRVFVVMPHKGFTLDVNKLDTVQYVKARIEEREGVEVDKQRLMFDGKELAENTFTLKQYNIQHDDNIELHVV